MYGVQVADFHCPFRTCQEAGLSSKDLENNKEFHAVVGGDFGQGVRGWYEAVKDESEGSSSKGNPYSSALMIVAEKNEGPKQKVHECCILECIVLYFCECLTLLKPYFMFCTEFSM